MTSLGHIRTRAGYDYPLDEEDLLWLARAAQFEGGDPAATIWTYAQRLARAEGSSLAALVRAHSQPLNPRWDEPSDELCQQHPDRCTPAQLERRRRARTTPWERLDTRVRNLVTRFANAALANPVPRAVDFADPTVATAFLRRNPGATIVKKAGNWYLATVDSRRWAADHVFVQRGLRIATAVTGPGLFGALALGGSLAAIAVMFWRIVR